MLGRASIDDGVEDSGVIEVVNRFSGEREGQNRFFGDINTLGHRSSLHPCVANNVEGGVEDGARLTPCWSRRTVNMRQSPPFQSHKRRVTSHHSTEGDVEVEWQTCDSFFF